MKKPNHTSILLHPLSKMCTNLRLGIPSLTTELRIAAKDANSHPGPHFPMAQEKSHNA
jgi:hypothetical protein